MIAEQQSTTRKDTAAFYQTPRTYRHVDGSAVATDFREVRESPDMIQMTTEHAHTHHIQSHARKCRAKLISSAAHSRGCRLQVSDDDAIESTAEVAVRSDAREVGVAAVVEVPHVHAAVEHDPLAVDRHHRAALPDLLTRTCKEPTTRKCVTLQFHTQRKRER